MAKKGKPASARKKARPAAKPAKKAAKRAPAKAAARKAPAKARKAARPAKAAPRKASPKKVLKKAFVKKTPVKKVPAKAAAPAKAAPVKAAPEKAAPEKAAREKAVPEQAVAVKAPKVAKAPKVPAAPPAPEPVAAAPAEAPAVAVEEAAAPAVKAPARAPKSPRKREGAPKPARVVAEPEPVVGDTQGEPLEIEPGLPDLELAAIEAEVATAGEVPGATKSGGLPPIRPYRGTQSGKPAKGKHRQKKRSRDRYSKIFAEFESKPATPDRKKKRRLLEDEDEDTSISVLRERPRLQIESPEQIRAGVIKKYLETGQPSCPVGCGGIAEVVRVGTLEDGSGEVWIECLSCAQRERFIVPKSTPAERQTAQQAMEEAGESFCPRHGRQIQLRRRGRDLVCPDCGVLYPEP